MENTSLMNYLKLLKSLMTVNNKKPLANVYTK